MAKKASFITSIIFLLMFTVLAGCASNQSAGGSNNNETNDSSSGEKTDYPTKPITIVVPFAAGGAGDTFSRTFAKIAEENLGQSIVVENKAGGSGAIANNYALNQPADGYTILYHSSTLPFTMASGAIPFTPDDIDPIASVVSNYQVLAVPKDSPFKTVEDFIQYAKENPNKLKVSGSGMNGTNHVFALKIMEGADAQFEYVSYDGGSEALRAILGGNVDGITVSGEVVTQQVESGKLRLLAVSSAERVESHPEVPTFKELGFSNIDDELIWRAFFAKPGISQERLDKFNEVITKVIEDPQWQKYLENTNQQSYYKSGEEFADIVNNYYESGKSLFEKFES